MVLMISSLAGCAGSPPATSTSETGFLPDPRIEEVGEIQSFKNELIGDQTAAGKLTEREGLQIRSERRFASQAIGDFGHVLEFTVRSASNRLPQNAQGTANGFSQNRVTIKDPTGKEVWFSGETLGIQRQGAATVTIFYARGQGRYQGTDLRMVCDCTVSGEQLSGTQTGVLIKYR